MMIITINTVQDPWPVPVPSREILNFILLFHYLPPIPVWIIKTVDNNVSDIFQCHRNSKDPSLSKFLFSSQCIPFISPFNRRLFYSRSDVSLRCLSPIVAIIFSNCYNQILSFFFTIICFYCFITPVHFPEMLQLITARFTYWVIILKLFCPFLCFRG